MAQSRGIHVHVHCTCMYMYTHMLTACVAAEHQYRTAEFSRDEQRYTYSCCTWLSADKVHVIISVHTWMYMYSHEY